MNRKIVIAGGGIAGLNAAKAAREQDPESSIVVLEREDNNTYIRTRLPDYISGAASYNALFPYDDAWYNENNIVLKKNTRILEINFKKKAVSTDKGLHEFDSLVITLGSQGNVPPIPGKDLENCFPVRTIADADRIKKLSGHGKTCTIIGGGLLGLEMAWAIRQLGCNINIIQSGPRLLTKQIDDQGAVLLHKAVLDKGMSLFLDAKVQEIVGNEKAEFVKLQDGTEIKSDFVIFSIGVKANTKLFADSGINISRSIVVDEYMKTNIDGVYAAGDVAEYKGKNFSIWPIGIAQGKIAGCNAAGGKLKYDEINPYTSLKIKGITMFSIGDVFAEDTEAIAEFDMKSNRYVKLFIKDDIITAAIVFGDPALPLKIKKAVEQKIKLPAIREGISIKKLVEGI